MYLLDTNVVSELRKVRIGKANARVAGWSDSVDAASLFISAVTLLELEIGVLLMERKDPAQGRPMRTWLDEHVRPTFHLRMFPIDEAVALQCARLHIPNPRPERDAMIAATALVHSMTVVTRNLKDF
ncbi:MAG: type II toxin-antitoxin system VapC family toxin, partial [Alphaproteobacteria bacterium]|nr:type II toxin-antitoxin system VapC family toxin [Alphaproteobacteria bacterium]